MKDLLKSMNIYASEEVSILKIQTHINGVVLFDLAFFMIVTGKAFGLSSEDKLYNIVFLLCGVFLSIKIILTKTAVGNWLRVFLIGLVCGGMVLCGHETRLPLACLFIIAAKDVNFEECMKKACRIYWCVIPIRIFLYFLGIVEGGRKPIYINHKVVGFTYGYGYQHPNTFFYTVFLAILLCYYVKRRKLRFIDIFVCSTVMTIVFAATLCKTGMMVYLFVVLGIVLYLFFPKSKKLLYGYCVSAIIMSVMIGIVCPSIHTGNSQVLKAVDYLFKGRLHWAKAAIVNTGITLFGRSTDLVDILYIDILANGGITGFLMVVIGTAVMLRGFLRDKNDVGILCTSALVLYSCMETYPINFAFNPLILYLGTNIFYREKNELKN